MDADSPQPPPPLSLPLERWPRRVRLMAALTSIAYLGLAVLGDAAPMPDGLYGLGPGQCLALLGLSFVNYTLRFMRWHGYLQALGARARIGRYLLIQVAGFAFTVTPGKACEAARSVYLRTAGVPWSQGLAALAVKRVLDLTAMVILAALALRAFADQARPALVLVVDGAVLARVICRSVTLWFAVVLGIGAVV